MFCSLMCYISNLYSLLARAEGKIVPEFLSGKVYQAQKDLFLSLSRKLSTSIVVMPI